MTHQSHSIYPDTTLIQKDTRTPMFTAARFTIDKTWKRLKCPATDEWIQKMWYICAMEYYSAMKQNKITPFAVTWMQLEIIISRSERKRQIPYDITYIWNLKYINANEPIYAMETGSRNRQVGG